MILMHNSPEMVRPWLEPLEDCIRSGDIPFKQAHGADLFSYMDAHPAFDRLFAQAMDSVENLTGTAFLDDFNWGAFRRVIDVGGSRGHKALTILKAHPHLRAIVFDRPQVIAEASTAWQGKVAADVLERVTFQAGDMLESIPAAHSDEDLYVFSAIYHCFNDTDSQRTIVEPQTRLRGKTPVGVDSRCCAGGNASGQHPRFLRHANADRHGGAGTYLERMAAITGGQRLYAGESAGCADVCEVSGVTV